METTNCLLGGLADPGKFAQKLVFVAGGFRRGPGALWNEERLEFADACEGLVRGLFEVGEPVLRCRELLAELLQAFAGLGNGGFALALGFQGRFCRV